MYYHTVVILISLLDLITYKRIEVIRVMDDRFYSIILLLCRKNNVVEETVV